MCGRLLSGATKSPLDRFKPKSEDYLLITAVVCLVFALSFAFFAGFFKNTPASGVRGTLQSATIKPVETTLNATTTLVASTSSTVAETTAPTSSVLSQQLPSDLFSGAGYSCESSNDSFGVSYRVLVSGGMARIDMFSNSGNLTQVLVGNRSFTSSGSGLWYGDFLQARVSDEVLRVFSLVNRSFGCVREEFDGSVFEVPAGRVVDLSI